MIILDLNGLTGYSYLIAFLDVNFGLHKYVKPQPTNQLKRLPAPPLIKKVKAIPEIDDNLHRPLPDSGKE